MDVTSHPIHPYVVRLARLVQSLHDDKLKSEMTTDQLATPSHLADIGTLIKNCDRMLGIARDRNVTLRPHVKTHKTIEGALLQLYGSDIQNLTLQHFKETSKIVVSTLGEAKFYADHGFCDILFASPIVPSKMKRIDAILDGKDEESEVHSETLRRRLQNGEIQGLSPIHATTMHASGGTSGEGDRRRRMTPREMGVQIAVLIDSEFGFEVVKSKLRQIKEAQQEYERQRRGGGGLGEVDGSTKKITLREISSQNETFQNETSPPRIYPKPLKLWLDIDGGYHRTGMNYQEDSSITTLLSSISDCFFGPSAEFKAINGVEEKKGVKVNEKTRSSNTQSLDSQSLDSQSSNPTSSNQPSSESKTSSIPMSLADLSAQVILDGLYYHGGNSYGATSVSEIEAYAAKERDAVKEMSELCEARGMRFQWLAVGSTPTCSRPPPSLFPINELHPGNYIFYDSWQTLIGSCDATSNASFVLAQVLSTYHTPDRVAFDAGALGLSKDLGATHVRDLMAKKVETLNPSNSTSLNPTSSSNSNPTSSSTSTSSNSSSPMSSHPIQATQAPAEFGTLTSHADSLYIARITQEMGIIQVRPHVRQEGNQTINAHQLMPPGTRFRIIPNHSCLSAACYPTLFITHLDMVVDEWLTAPRIW